MLSSTTRSVHSDAVAIITGGGGTLARAVTEVLQADGWRVLAPSHAELDVAEYAGVADWFAQQKRCDLLINNAGVVRDHAFAKMSESDWDCVFRTNMLGTARCARAAAHLMTQQAAMSGNLPVGGQIINISSFSALSGPVGQSNYACAKAAILGFTQELARELGPANIRVNAVLPGFLESPMTNRLPPKTRERALAAHVLGRFTTAHETARFIAFLATTQHLSGQIFSLDSRIHGWQG